MPHLAVVFWFLFAPVANEISFGVLPDAVAAAMRVDPCAVAEQMAAQRPCLRPEDCGAFEDWTRLFGVPRNELLNPELAKGEVSRVFWRGGPDLQLREIPTSYLCLATVSSEGMPFEPTLKPARSALGPPPVR